MAEWFNQYFVNITNSQPIEPYMTIPSYVPLRVPIIDALRKYENQPSIAMIQKNIRYTQASEFKPISCADFVNEINNLHSSKKTSGTLSVDIIKKIIGICHTQIAEYFNSMLLSCEFPDILKTADVSEIHKGSDPTSKINYRLLVYPRQCLRYLNACWRNRSYLLSTLKYQLCCALTEKTIVLSTHSFG